MSSTNLASLDSATYWEKKQDQLSYILHITHTGKRQKNLIRWVAGERSTRVVTVKLIYPSSKGE
jgi:hypothetical protein